MKLGTQIALYACYHGPANCAELTGLLDTGSRRLMLHCKCEIWIASICKVWSYAKSLVPMVGSASHKRRLQSTAATCEVMAGVLQARLQHVLEEIDPVDLSHVMWAMARFDSYPAPGLLDAVLATLPPQIASAEAAV